MSVLKSKHARTDTQKHRHEDTHTHTLSLSLSLSLFLQHRQEQAGTPTRSARERALSATVSGKTSLEDEAPLLTTVATPLNFT